MIFGHPIVVFRGPGGAAGALEDRCPHRNVPLSMGSVETDGTLQCRYHGWRFDREGACVAVPGLVEIGRAAARSCPSFATREQDGVVWVWGAPRETPTCEPPRLRHAFEDGYTTLIRATRAEATLFSTIENALDVPHTAFLHGGLFRTKNRQIAITARVRGDADRVEAEYIGEPRPSGIVGRLLAPSGGEVVHFDRFILPSIAEVEYRLGPDAHVLITSLMTPEDDFSTRLLNVIRVRTRGPRELVARIAEPFGRWIFSQDAALLRRQTETIRTFGGERFAWTQADVLGKHILRLLRAAERGTTVSSFEEERTLVL